MKKWRKFDQKKYNSGVFFNKTVHISLENAQKKTFLIENITKKGLSIEKWCPGIFTWELHLLISPPPSVSPGHRTVMVRSANST